MLSLVLLSLVFGGKKKKKKKEKTCTSIEIGTVVELEFTRQTHT